MKLNVLRANPAGNITMFVLDPVEREARGSVAEKLMALTALGGEQVAYVCVPEAGTDGSMEMAGGEFCGNATRAFGMLLAKQRQLTGKQHLTVRVSGAEKPIGVDTDLAAGTARSEMPLPRFVEPRCVNGVRGTLVHLGGIAHFVLDGVAPSMEFFLAAEGMFSGLVDVNAYGVMFHDRESGRMTPLVKVPAANTLVWEGSCGSGTLASAVAHSVGEPDGEYRYQYIQPAGTVCAEIERKNGRVTAAYIGGAVTLDAPQAIELC